MSASTHYKFCAFRIFVTYCIRRTIKRDFLELLKNLCYYKIITHANDDIAILTDFAPIQIIFTFGVYKLCIRNFSGRSERSNTVFVNFSFFFSFFFLFSGLIFINISFDTKLRKLRKYDYDVN